MNDRIYNILENEFGSVCYSEYGDDVQEMAKHFDDVVEIVDCYTLVIYDDDAVDIIRDDWYDAFCTVMGHYYGYEIPLVALNPCNIVGCMLEYYLIEALIRYLDERGVDSGE